MDEQHKARLVKQIRGLRLSQSDMNQARFAAQVIPANHGDMRRLLETALAVTYARPFTDGLSMSRKKWEPKPATQRQIHDRMIELRNELYAHTDDTPDRDVVDTAKMLGRGEHTYAEQWTEMNDAEMPAIAEMAERQRNRFKAKADELESILQAASSTQPNLVPLFHRTTTAKAQAILADGFKDSNGTYPTEEQWTGVQFFDERDAPDEIAAGEALLYIDVPEARIAEYEWVEYGKPYREWIVPAALANEYHPPAVLGD